MIYLSFEWSIEGANRFKTLPDILRSLETEFRQYIEYKFEYLKGVN